MYKIDICFPIFFCRNFAYNFCTGFVQSMNENDKSLLLESYAKNDSKYKRPFCKIYGNLNEIYKEDSLNSVSFFMDRNFTTMLDLILASLNIHPFELPKLSITNAILYSNGLKLKIDEKTITYDSTSPAMQMIEMNSIKKSLEFITDAKVLIITA